MNPLCMACPSSTPISELADALTAGPMALYSAGPHGDERNKDPSSPHQPRVRR